jgi:RNase P/RNase MRP subunit POP5
MKPLKPAHRENKRYLLLAGRDANKEEVEQAILDYIGILGFAQTCPQFLRLKTGKNVLAINREALDKVRASLLISGKDISVVKVSGTVKGLG